MTYSSEQMQDELAFQAKRAAKIEQIAPTPEYVIDRYKKNSLWWIFPKEMLFKTLNDPAGKDILDIGCGEGELSTQLAKLGARVTAVDISPDLIRVAKKRAQIDDVGDRMEFLVRDILEAPLPKGRFDAIVCSAVLHHVDIRKFFPVLLSGLKTDGVAIMIEPLGLSPFLRKLRNVVPLVTDASPGEHPLNKEELNFVLGSLTNVRATYYELVSRLQVFLRNRNKIDRGHPYTKAILFILGCVDRFLLRVFPFLSVMAGEVVIVGRKFSG
jgi:2-polyprenyl-3-methyl-5-hydroxy-6-metoxy-1,4-benzoquinol methylase